jgi:hypothetical protein
MELAEDDTPPVKNNGLAVVVEVLKFVPPLPVTVFTPG